MTERCRAFWNDAQCDLPVGHASAHRARTDSSLAWWANGAARRVGREPDIDLPDVIAPLAGLTHRSGHPDCGALLVNPHVQLSSVGCPEHGHHRTIRCLDCGHIMLEPPCDRAQSGIGSLSDGDEPGRPTTRGGTTQ